MSNAYLNLPAMVPPLMWARVGLLLLVGVAVWVVVYVGLSGRRRKKAGDPKPCPNCGELVPPFAHFCPRCGRAA